MHCIPGGSRSLHLARTGKLALVLAGGALMIRGSILAGETAPQSTVDAPLVFDRVTVVDVEHGKLLLGQRVVIAGNRIQAVGPTDRLQVSRNAHVVDAEGKYLIPGLWDMNVWSKPMAHLAYPLLLANGVTGIRHYAPEVPLDSLVLWWRKIMAGAIVGPPRQLIGPTIDEKESCKRVDETWRHTCVNARDTADVRHLLDSVKAIGANMIGVYNLSRDMFLTIATETRRRGLFSGGQSMHVPLTEASDSGFGIVDYPNLNQDLNARCLYDKASVEQCRPIAERLRRNGTWWVPTWVALQVGSAHTQSIYASYGMFVGDFWAADSTSSGSLHDYLRRAAGGDAAAPAPADDNNSFFDFAPLPPRGGTIPDSAGYLYVVRLAGLPVLAGTEAGIDPSSRDLPGFLLHTELAAYAAEGLTPLEALQTATLNPAKFLRGTDSLGTVATGKLADLVLLDANPLADITNTTRIRAVVANGRYFDRAALDSLLAEVKAKAQKEP